MVWSEWMQDKFEVAQLHKKSMERCKWTQTNKFSLDDTDWGKEVCGRFFYFSQEFMWIQGLYDFMNVQRHEDKWGK